MKRVLAALLILVGAAAAGLPRPVAAEIFAPETFTLENGLQVVVVVNDRAPVVSHWVWYKVGAADETVGKTGLAHFLEHLMFRGSKNLAPGAYSQRIALMGGEENAFTAADYTAYYATVAAEHLEAIIALEAERMANLVLTDAVVLPERDVILEERRQRVDNDPASQLGEMLQSALYLNVAYRNPTIGWEHEMQGLTTADALAFYERWYAPNNAVLIVVGDVAVDEVRRLAESYFGPIARREVPSRERAIEPAQFAPRRVQLESDRVQQPGWTRSYQAPSYATAGAEHAYALQLLAQILGGDSSARLYRRLVIEQKLAIGLSAGYSPERLGIAAFSISATPPAAGDIAALEAAIDAEIAGLLAEGITAEELANAKSALAADVIKARDGITGPARILGRALASGGTIEDLEAWPERIEAVTVEQVLAAARAIFDINRSATALLLPKKTS